MDGCMDVGKEFEYIWSGVWRSQPPPPPNGMVWYGVGGGGGGGWRVRRGVGAVGAAAGASQTRPA